MPAAILCLILCQLAGQVVSAAARLPVPGPVIGMFLLALLLVLRGGRIPMALDRTAEALVGTMGLLFVPAGVGVIAEVSLLRQQWLPIAAALIGSTVLSVMVTGLVMRHTARAAEAARTTAPRRVRLGGLRHG